MKYFKKGEMGLGLLITLIAFMIVSAIAAGTVLVSSGELRSSALGIFKEGEKGLANFLQFIIIDASDGTESTLNNFTIMARLAPGSDSINLNKSLFVMKNRQDIAYLKYTLHRDGANLSTGADGFMTFKTREYGAVSQWNDTVQEENNPRISTNPATSGLVLDLDNDGTSDDVLTCCEIGTSACPAAFEDSHIMFNLSSGVQAYVGIRNPTTGNLISNLCDPAAGIEMFNNKTPIIGTNGITYGYVDINTTNINDNSVDGAPGTGDFTIVYANPELLSGDINQDGRNDYVGLNATHAEIWVSGPERGSFISIALNGGNDWGGVGTSINVNSQITGEAGENLGSLNIAGTVATANTFPESGTFFFTPNKIYRGWFSVEWLEEGNTYRPGYISQGDVVKIYIESPAGVIGGDQITFGLTSDEVEYFAQVGIDVPNYDSIQQVILYP